MSNIGIFGGTFDPPHLGHLAIAKKAYDELNLDNLLFMPNHIPAYKLEQHGISSAKDRLNMLNILLEGLDWCEISTFELDREGNTYTSDTLSLLTNINKGNHYYLIIGSDSYKDLGEWHDPETIFKLSTIVVLLRDGDSISSMSEYTNLYQTRFNARVYILNNDICHISSTELREIFKAGETTSEWLPPALSKYIVQHKLYH